MRRRLPSFPQRYHTPAQSSAFQGVPEVLPGARHQGRHGLWCFLRPPAPAVLRGSRMKLSSPLSPLHSSPSAHPPRLPRPQCVRIWPASGRLHRKCWHRSRGFRLLYMTGECPQPIQDASGSGAPGFLPVSCLISGAWFPLRRRGSAGP